MKILIADDHLIVREGLKQILRKLFETAVIEESENGSQALKQLECSKYDLVIMDISMPDMSGLDVLKILNEKNIILPILMLSVYPQEIYAIRAMKLGASGYLSKNSVYQELENAIKAIQSGNRYVSRSLAEKIIFDKKGELTSNPHEKLSEREFQIMCMIAKGKSNKEIAAELFISDKTVGTHRMRILEKMEMKRNTDLTTYAIRNGLIE
jgi:two-component system, NarL family, invasion response regulator UvrY